MLGRIRGWKAIVHDAVDFSVDLVEAGHDSVGRNAMRVLGRIAPIAAPARLVNELRRASTSLTLDSVRGINRLVQRLTDVGLDSELALQLLPWLRERPSQPIAMRSDVVGSAPWLSDAALGALNGAVGDYLQREASELDLGFVLRYRDEYFDAGRLASDLAPVLPGRVAIFVHGLGTTEWSWCYNAAECHGDAAACFGTMLERDAGLAPIHVRYNSGQRVAENGRLLADALEQLSAARGEPFEELVLIGHSMGGLVVRSACHFASVEGLAWGERVSRVFSLGTPHRGAPLEQLGSLATLVLGSIDLPGTTIPAEILRRRSAGVRDLGRGSSVDDGVDEQQLAHAAYYFVSATVTRDRAHPLGWLIGDVLVRVPSASGPAVVRPDLRIEKPCFGGVVHQEIQCHPGVYALIRDACRSGTQSSRRIKPSGSR